MLNLFDKQNNPKIIICCGSGGVGKTTIAATLALHGALSGLKALVLTIDPAKRLVDSLGITSLGYKAQHIPQEKYNHQNFQIYSFALYLRCLP